MNLQDWQDIVTDSIRTVLSGFVAAIPGVVAALVTLLIGWVLARVVRGVLERVFKAAEVDKRMEAFKLDVLMEKMGVKTTPSQILAKTAYFLILLVFTIAATETLGWSIISEEFAKLLSFVPKVIVGLLIFAIGYFIAGLVRDVLGNATEALGVGAGKMIASLVYYFLLITVALSAMEQMGIPTDIISENLQLIIGAIVIAGAISYGLASRNLLSHTLSTYYSRNLFTVGQRIRVSGVTGEIIEISNIAVVLKTESGKTIIPASELTTQRVDILD
jgi:hypothetical protein